MQEVLFRLTMIAAEATIPNQKLLDFSSIEKVTRFAIASAVNVIKKKWRAESRRKIAPLPNEDILPDKPADEFAEILNWIDDPEVRESVRLRAEEDYPYQKIAELMNISTGQAHKLVKRGLQQIRRRLEQ